MTLQQHVMVSRARRGKGPATKKQHRRKTTRTSANAATERQQRLERIETHTDSGQR